MREPRQSPRVMSPLTQHTATYLRYQHMSLRVLGLPTLTGIYVLCSVTSVLGVLTWLLVWVLPYVNPTLDFLWPVI